MTPELATSSRPTRTELLATFGPDYVSVDSLFGFCQVPPAFLDHLMQLVQPENWSTKCFVLLGYLAVHVRLGIEQGLYVWNSDQLVLRAGQLVTAAGSPIYVSLTRNAERGASPWGLDWAGERPARVEALKPADLGTWPALDPRNEVVIACDLVFLRSVLGALASLPFATQLSAIAGAIERSIRRGLAVRQIHGQSRGYFAPVYLTSRAAAPELVAQIQIHSGRLMVRGLFDPRTAYAPARAVAERREQLPTWLLT